MGIECDVVCAYGLAISPEECARLEIELDDCLEDFLEGEPNDGWALPVGFGFVAYGSCYKKNGTGLILVPHNFDIDALIQREIPLPDFSPLLKWASDNGVNFMSDKPSLHRAMHIY